MIVLYALTGVLVGSGLNWLSHRLPRYATSRVVTPCSHALHHRRVATAEGTLRPPATRGAAAHTVDRRGGRID